MAYEILPENHYINPFREQSTNDDQMDTMKKISENILKQLTERQRRAITLHFHGKTKV